MSCADLPPLFGPTSDAAFFGPRKKSPVSAKLPATSGKKDGAASETANRILLLGRIHELALYRAEVLRDRGFEVRMSTDREQAVNLIRGGDFDAVVLSYTLSSDTVEELADEVREHCPGCPVVVISKTPGPDRRIAPDALALADEGPKALVAALRSVLRRH
jgi:DNA-binding response OmpR family regulator